MYAESMTSKLKKRIWIPGPVIVGAGPSGLAAAACLKQIGVPYLILEKEDCLASLWKLKTYDFLKLHLPKEVCQLPHMKFPPDFPAYPSKHHFISYLEDYATHFSIDPIFGKEVHSATFDSKAGFWRVLADEYEFLCHWLVVATGENAEQVVPDIAGISDFEGKILHTSMYKNGAEFTGRKVLVVGCGNSGMEVSSDLCNHGAQVSLSVRSKLHILPKEMFGVSTFSISMHLLKWLSLRLVDKFLLFCSWLTFGDTRRIGIERPEMGPLELKKFSGRTPVLDVGTIAKIKSREIKVMGEVRRFTPWGAEFSDGRHEDFKFVILATGYRSNFTSWLKDRNRGENCPEDTCCGSHWKGENGLYKIGFSRNGMLGISQDAKRVAEDIARHWSSEMKHLRLQS